MDGAISQPGCAAGIEMLCHDFPVQGDWLAFNGQLDRDAAGIPNEALLVRRLESLQRLDVSDPPVGWLTVARITELALKAAGDYADAGNFQAAGDLLANPRWVDVWQRGCAVPVRKPRHRSLSGQFADAIDGQDPIAWLCQHTYTMIRDNALLPQLAGMLASSGVLAGDYVASIDQRMCRIAETITFLHAWQVGDGMDLVCRLGAADDDDREMITNHLCLFDLDGFAALGDAIEKRIVHKDDHCRFLRRSGTVSTGCRADA